MPLDQHVSPDEELSSTSSPSRPMDPAADGTAFILRDPASGVRIPSQVARIGRGPDNNIVVVELGVSKQHAELRRTSAGRFSIIDLGSHNGTYVNGTRISEQEQDGLRALAAGNLAVLPVLDRLGIRPEPEA